MQEGSLVRCEKDLHRIQRILEAMFDVKILIPEVGQIYIVRAVIWQQGKKGLLLEEIRNQVLQRWGNKEPAFDADAFSELDSPWETGVIGIDRLFLRA